MSDVPTILVYGKDDVAVRAACDAVRRVGYAPEAPPEGAERAGARPAAALVLVAGDDPATAAREVAEACARIGSHAIPLVASIETGDLAASALEAGAIDFLVAPYGDGALRARLQAAEARGRAGRAGSEMVDARVMLELTQALASAQDFREILYTVVRRVADAVRVSRASIVLSHEPGQEEVGYVVVTSDDEQLTNLKLDLTKYPEVQRVLRTREPLTVKNARSHPVLDRVREDLPEGDLGSISLFPIVWEEQASGVLFLRVGGERGPLTVQESHFCQVVANATAVALRNARVMQTLKDRTQQITFARFEAEQRLRSLKRYADLFASAAEGIAVADAKGVLLFANPRAFETLGYEEQELVGARLRQVIHRDDWERTRELWAGFARGEFPRGVDLRAQRKDGETVVVCCSFAALADSDSAVLISLQDVTEQRRTEAELVKTMEFLESLIDASVDGIVAADMEGNIILFNQGAESIYGHRTEDVVGLMSARELYPGDGAEHVMRMLRSADHGGVGRLEPMSFTARNASGEEVPIQLSAAMIYERGEAVATFGIFTDLREKLRVERRLAEAQQKLAVTEKQALIAELAGTAAHELNQPLTSIVAYAELLMRKIPPESKEHRALEVIMEQAERMAGIVKKIGKMTKYEVMSYVGEQNILDLDASSRDTDPHGTFKPE